MKNLFLIALLVFCQIAQAQTIHYQEPITGHYKTFRELNPNPSLNYAWMDTIKYPPKEYGSSLTYVLVKPFYLSEQQVKLLTKSVRPPANSSEQTRVELEHLLRLQAERTPEQIARVRLLANIGYWPSINLLSSHPDYKENLDNLFFEGKEINGQWCNAQNFPAIAKVLQGAMQDMRVMEFSIKYTYFRPRPYHLEKSLQPLDRIGSPSFASGHTLWAFLHAYLWSEIIPEKRTAFLKLADEIRLSREIMGIHYPSDNEEARLITHRMLTFYAKKPDFVKALKQAKAEWKESYKLYK